ncbi:MAG TPA: macro domain-containing protein [Candidatus Cloacimonadota bacterium]|nr:macro domain-containing protein [Candidatus Cloacimonadota bacterium]HPT72687.1 macro domain-containing protein [Candidatus Cloacimonadota bacterium]
MIEIVKGDITKMQVDAIVNAANTSLRSGGGVDGAIHLVAGPSLLEECIRIGRCPVGEARLTLGYRLPSSHVIHTVGPIWRDGQHGEEELLADCYRNTLNLANDNAFETVAFPAISTGAYGFPKILAAQIAIREIRDHERKNVYPKFVYIVCFDEETYEIYDQILLDAVL